MRFKRSFSGAVKRYASRGRRTVRPRGYGRKSIRPKREAKIPRSRDATRIRVCSQSFIDYYSDFHKSKDIMRDLCSVVQHLTDTKALDAISCLLEKLPYTKYFQLKDTMKETCRLVFQQIHHEMIHLKCIMFTPGSRSEARQIGLKAAQMVRNVAAKEYRSKAEEAIVDSLQEANAVGRNENIYGVPTAFGALHSFTHGTSGLGSSHPISHMET